MNTHTSLDKVDELHHFRLPHLPRKEPIYKILLKELLSQSTTPQWPIIPPLHKPCLSHVLDLISCQLSLLTCGQPHSQEYLIEFINEFLGVFLNLTPVEDSRVHSSEVL